MKHIIKNLQAYFSDRQVEIVLKSIIFSLMFLLSLKLSAAMPLYYIIPTIAF